MINYQYIEDAESPGNNASYGINKLVDSVFVLSIPNDPNNRHWKEYQLWLAEPNTPLAFDA